MQTVTLNERLTNEQSLRVLNREGKLVLLLHLQWNEQQPQDHTSHPHLIVDVTPAERYRSCLLRLLPLVVDETDPHGV